MKEFTNIPSINTVIQNLIAQWTKENPSPKWWEVWKKTNGLGKVVKFILNAVDSLILTVDKETIAGAEKKAAVLTACAAVYDFVALNAFPIWMKPFEIPIKMFLIYTVISTMIDWMVEKYKNGSWNSNN
jgi:hypothetical protein